MRRSNSHPCGFREQKEKSWCFLDLESLGLEIHQWLAYQSLGCSWKTFTLVNLPNIYLSWLSTLKFETTPRLVGVELQTMWIWGAKKKLVPQYLNRVLCGNLLFSCNNIVLRCLAMGCSSPHALNVNFPLHIYLPYLAQTQISDYAAPALGFRFRDLTTSSSISLDSRSTSIHFFAQPRAQAAPCFSPSRLLEGRSFRA